MAKEQEKKIAIVKPKNGVNSDADDTSLDPAFLRFMLNCRLFEPGYKGRVKTVKGTTAIPYSFPAGDNLCIGYGSNEEKNKFYFFEWNSNGYHGVYCYNDVNVTITPILRNLIDTNNVDIFFFDPAYLINHVDIIQDNLIYYVDGLNKARKFNIDKAVDKTAMGYGTIITEDFITAYKQTSPFAPQPVYFTDLTRNANYLYALQFKFAQRFIYDDGEQSNVSDYSIVPLPPNESFLGNDNITYNNNGLNVQVYSGNRLVTQIEILVKINDLDWQSCVVLDKGQIGITDNTNYIYAFYNDGPLIAVDNIKVARPYSFMPRVPFAQSFVKLAMTYSNADEGFPVVPITASVAVSSTNLYLPDSTTNLFNSPKFIVSNPNIDREAGSITGYWQTKAHFIVGADVKKGNTFVMIGQNGGSGSNKDNYYYSYTANVSDTSETVASLFKQFLRAINRGVPDMHNGISNELNVAGDISWDYTYIGHFDSNATLFAGSVNPVNYSTLKDNGLSVNVIKSGGPRKYAIVYEDDDGRKSLAYTADSLLATTPFLTQWPTAVLQQPIHTISIANRPPTFAKYWYLVRTPDITDFTQMLIQKITKITVINEGDYLDLIVGSIFEYQLIHPNTVVTYEFQKGDRVRLIRNENTGTLYTPYFETEVLSYKQIEEQTIKANIDCNGTTTVTPVDGVKTDYVGKNISINGVERNIVSISGSSYIVNEPISPNVVDPSNPTTVVTYPDYIIIDRRGILRINNTATLSTSDLPLIEVYHPQKSIANDQRQNFYDFGVKFGIINAGTTNAAHIGNIQNQDPANPVSTPCLVQTEQGDAYIRQRALPTNAPDNPADAQIIVDSVEDPNFSDFYQSNLYSTGRVYPQDDGSGVKNFNQRVRFSNNYIENTKINGLNDFDDTDRKDYNDAYGAITLSRFKRSYLYLYKQLKTTWTPVDQNIISDNRNNQNLITSSKLLNDLQYAVWEGGIGNDGAGWFENGDYQYIPSKNSGVFLRIAQDGSIPISSIYFYDKVARDFLSAASKNNLQIRGQFDKLNDEAIWSYLPFINYLFNGGFQASQWQTLTSSYPMGTTFTITQQPAHATATIISGIVNITGTNTLGDDYFLFVGNLPGGGTTPVEKFCFTVVLPTNRTIGYSQDVSTAYCQQSGGGNNGNQGWTILDGYYTDNNAATGFKMPNITQISPDAIVPLAATITFNVNSSPSPSGGSDGDIWYNLPVDALYKKISGVWTQLFNRLTNAFYAPPIVNTGACPIANHYTVFAAYGMTVTSVVDNTATGTPGSLTAISVKPNTSLSVAYTTITAGSINVVLTGTPINPRVRLNLLVAGVTVDHQDIPSAGTYVLTFPAPATSPTSISVEVDTF